MTLKTENHPVDVTIGALVAQKRTGTESGGPWREGLVEVEVLTVDPEGAPEAAGKQWG